MKRVRRLGTLALAALLVVPTGCASGSGGRGVGWEAGMMGAMIVGGLIVGRGMMHGGTMHGGRGASPSDTAFSVERFQPARLLEQRTLLELTDQQVAGLDALREDVAAQRRTPDDAARAAYWLLTPLQRAAVSNRTQNVQPHH